MDFNGTRFKLIQSMSEENSLGAIEWVLVALLLAIFLPLVPNRKLKYYSSYVSYIATVSTAAIVFLPFFAYRAKSVLNLRFTGNLLRHITKILGIEWELRNGEILRKEQSAVITANHQTILDILGMFNIWDVLDKCTAVAKRELMYVVPFGIAAWLGGLVFIDRKNPKIANLQMDTAFQRLKKEKIKFWVFPEGTRNGTGTLLPFKNGAFRVAIENQVPIIPIVYSPYYFIDSNNKTFDSGKIIISVLDPISTEGMTLEDIQSIKEKTYQAMLKEQEKLKKEIVQYRENEIKLKKY